MVRLRWGLAKEGLTELWQNIIQAIKYGFLLLLSWALSEAFSKGFILSENTFAKLLGYILLIATFIFLYYFGMYSLAIFYGFIGTISLFFTGRFDIRPGFYHISYNCPHCHYEINEGSFPDAGESMECPSCKKWFRT